MGQYSCDCRIANTSVHSRQRAGLAAGWRGNIPNAVRVISFANSDIEFLRRNSGGCPALRPTIAQALIDAIRDGSLVVAYYPDKIWLNSSPFIHDCATAGASDPLNTAIASVGKSSKQVP
jgi:hypothetical protein